MRAKNQCLLCKCRIEGNKQTYILAPVEHTSQGSKKDPSILDVKFNVHAKFLICKECIMKLVLERRFDNKLEIYEEMLSSLTLSRNGEEVKIGFDSKSYFKKDATQKDVDELIAKMAINSLKK